MSKLLVITFTLLINPISFANEDLKNYCKITEEKIKHFEESVKRKGRIKVSNRIGKKKPKYKDFRGCHMDTPLIKQTYESLCINKDVESLNDNKYPKMILWHFTGASFFNADLAYQHLSPVNIKGYEGRELIIGSELGTNQLSHIFNSIPELLDRNKVEFHYHAGSGLHSKENYQSAIECAVETKRTIDTINSFRAINYKPIWALTGFSNGGVSALNFQNQLPELGIEIDHAIIIDPVVKVHKFPFYGLYDISGKRNLNTKYLETYYQDIDQESLATIIGLKGKPVEGADINTKVPLSSFGRQVDRAHNHIFYTQEIMDSYQRLVDMYL